ncbi:hypothetical protein BMG523Draft_03541, partial [Frankia sp. BMG5.23]
DRQDAAPGVRARRGSRRRRRAVGGPFPTEDDAQKALMASLAELHGGDWLEEA